MEANIPTRKYRGAKPLLKYKKKQIGFSESISFSRLWYNNILVLVYLSLIYHDDSSVLNKYVLKIKPKVNEINHLTKKRSVYTSVPKFQLKLSLQLIRSLAKVSLEFRFNFIEVSEH